MNHSYTMFWGLPMSAYCRLLCRYKITHFEHVDCEDVGETGLARRRRIDVVVLTDALRVICGTKGLYAKLCARVKTVQFLAEDMFCEQDRRALIDEAMRFYNTNCDLSKCTPISEEVAVANLTDWSAFLSANEQSFRRGYTDLWMERHGCDAAGDNRAVFQLSQDPRYSPAMSKINDEGLGTISTFCAGSSTRCWSEYHRRWMTGKEKCAAMMLPVFPNHSNAACVPMIEYTALTNPHVQTGNGINVGNALLIQMAVLGSLQWAPQRCVATDAPEDSGPVKVPPE